MDENDNGRVDGGFGACGAFGMFIAVVTPVLLIIEGCNIFLRSKKKYLIASAITTASHQLCQFIIVNVCNLDNLCIYFIRIQKKE